MSAYTPQVLFDHNRRPLLVFAKGSVLAPFIYTIF